MPSAKATVPVVQVAVLVFFLAVVASSVQAEDLIVYPDGSGDYPTIQAALDAAEDHDAVFLSNGTYTGDGNRDLDFSGKYITVGSLNGNADLCIINCEGSEGEPHRGFTFSSSQYSYETLENITITGGWSSIGGAVLVNGCSPTIRYCVLRGNTSADGAGIAIRGANANPKINGCTIRDNDGTGISVHDDTGEYTISDCNILRNSGSGFLLGASDFFADTKVTLRDCRVEENGADGLLQTAYTSYLFAESCELVNNEGWGYRGNVASDAYGGVTDCLVEGNGSGGVHLSCTEFTYGVTGCRVLSNGGDGVFASSISALASNTIRFNEGYGLRVAAIMYSISDNDISFNQQGGIWSVANGGTGTIANCLVVGNGGHGVEFNHDCTWGECDLLLSGCTISDNTGKGFTTGSGVPCVLTGNIVTGNGQEAVSLTDPSQADLTCNDFYDNAGGDWTSGISSHLGINGNFSQDPRFFSPADSLYTLAADSPCLPGNHPTQTDCGTIGALAAAVDEEAPIVTLATIPNGEPGSPCTISVDVADIQTVEEVFLIYRTGGSAQVDSVSMIPYGGSTWSAAIPADVVTPSGVQYRVRAVDPSGNTTILGGDSGTGWASLSVALDGYETFQTPALEYGMYTIPYEPEYNSPLAFFDELGGQYDATRWRYGAWNPQAGVYEEPPLAAGSAFWLITRQAQTIRGSGTTAALDEDFPIPLQQGANQIGSPFGFPVDWSAVGRSGNVEDFLHAYNGTDYDAASHQELEPGRGYVVFCNTAVDTLWIPPAPATGKVRSTPPIASDWEAVCSASTGGRRMGGFRFGVVENIRSEKAVAIHAPPAPPGATASLALVDDFGNRLKWDLRGRSLSGQTWRLELFGEPDGSSIRVEMDLSGELPPGWKLVALNENTRQSREMQGGVGVLRGADTWTEATSWTLVAGTPEFLAGRLEEVNSDLDSRVSRFRFRRPYPNPVPAGDGVTLAFDLPTRARVGMTVFDLRGRVVRRLEGLDLGQGAHQFIWYGDDQNGRRMPAGTYFCRLTGGPFTKTQKVLLIR